MHSFLNSTINSCKEYALRGDFNLTSTLFGVSITNALASGFNQKTNIISSLDCLTDSVYKCASITQEVALKYLLPSAIEALEKTNSWDNLVLFADKITYCVLPESDLIKSACWGALSNAHYIAGAVLGMSLCGYSLYRGCTNTPTAPELDQTNIEVIANVQNHQPRQVQIFIAASAILTL